MAQRKLQSEIEKTFKRVSEGLNTFEDIYSKLQPNSTSTNLKEKYEADLKREIKKLQRYRDQIKTWGSSSEIKDKKALSEHRRQIEHAMERFKALEKEMKTKAFSKEGLASTRVDPRAQAKNDTIKWISEAVERLTFQNEKLDADLELLQTKKGRQVIEQKEALLERIRQYQYHINILERLQRQIDNNTVNPEDVDRIREDVMYYVDNSEYVDGGDPDDVPYDSVPYDSIISIDDDEFFPQSEDDLPTGGSSHRASVSGSPATSAASTPAPGGGPGDESDEHSDSSSADESATPHPEEPAQSQLKATSPAAGKGAAATPQGTAASSRASTPPTQPEPNAGQPADELGAPTPEHFEAAVSLQLFIDNDPAATADASAAEGAASSPASDFVLSVYGPEAAAAAHESYNEGLYSTLLQSYRKMCLDAHRSDQQQKTHLDVSFSSRLNKPGYGEPEKPRMYFPAQPAEPTSYYPQRIHPALSGEDDVHSKALFSKFTVDALFLAFYFHQGTRAQFLAARALKNCGWRFHTQLKTWFLRGKEPTSVGRDHEKGLYYFFDYSDTWSVKTRNEFTFEYKYLEDEVL